MHSNKMGETPQEQQLLSMATSRMNDYQNRWLPLQMKLAQTANAMYAPGSEDRARLQGEEALSARAGASQEGAAIGDTLSERGETPGSGQFKLAQTGAVNRGVAGAGAGVETANSKIDEAYLATLGELTQVGERQAAGALQTAGGSAGISQQRAFGNAYDTAQTNARTAGMIGSAAGMAGAAIQGMPASTPQAGTSGLVDSGNGMGPVAPEIANFQPAAIPPSPGIGASMIPATI